MREITPDVNSNDQAGGQHNSQGGDQSPGSALHPCNDNRFDVHAGPCVQDEGRARLAGAVEESSESLGSESLSSESLEPDVQELNQRAHDLEAELKQSQQVLDLTRLQLYQVEEELERSFFQVRDLSRRLKRQDAKLQWLRDQRQILLKQMRHQASLIRRLSLLTSRALVVATPAARPQPGWAAWLGRHWPFGQA
jgi:septal ring factor EnvC (AmiA/AmiB activator)